MNTYRITHRAHCPNNSDLDAYTITIKSPRTIMVEKILEALAEAPGIIYQEDLTTHLCDTLDADVTITGWHQGVFVKSTRIAKTRTTGSASTL